MSLFQISLKTSYKNFLINIAVYKCVYYIILIYFKVKVICNYIESFECPYSEYSCVCFLIDWMPLKVPLNNQSGLIFSQVPILIKLIYIYLAYRDYKCLPRTGSGYSLEGALSFKVIIFRVYGRAKSSLMLMPRHVFLEVWSIWQVCIVYLRLPCVAKRVESCVKYVIGSSVII